MFVALFALARRAGPLVAEVLVAIVLVPRPEVARPAVA
jgi:hypothetical protein